MNKSMIKSRFDRPVCLEKMLVDDVGDVTVINDRATLLEVERPAAKVI